MIFLWIAFALFTGCIVAGFVWTWRLRQQEQGDSFPLWPLVGSLSVVGVFVWLILLGVGTLGTQPLADGCYRVATTTSTTVVSTGKTVTPIIVSGKTYTPIPCP